jgi:glycosyltransferase involved in cell wall biosynthesis
MAADDPGDEMNASALAVDIVINNHNYGQFLGHAVQAALDQDYPNVRVIVVDDGSTDNSHDVLREYAERIEIVLKPQGGQASAVNVGFERSNGDVVIFLDADDMLERHAASRVAAVFASDERIVKVQYRMQVVDAAGKPTGAYRPHIHTPLPNGDLSRAEVTFPYDLPWPGMSANAFRTQALRRILPMPEGRPSGADWYLVHLVALLGHVGSLDEVLGSYRVHGGNMYARQQPKLDLGHIRMAVACADLITPQIEQLADEVGVRRRPGPILSVADLANRLVSVKLEPDLHPLGAESVWRLALDGLRAARRRYDVAWEMKMLLASWFLLTAVVPKPFARALARPFLMPEARPRLNPLLGRLHKWNRISG